MTSARRSVILSFSERYATLLIFFFSTIVLARLLTPAELGVFSVGMAVVSLAHSIRDFGISSFLVQEPRLTQDQVFTAAWISIGLAWIIGSAIVVASGPIAAFYHEPALASLIVILAGSFFILPFSSLRMALLRRDMAFGPLLRINVSAALVQASLSILLVAGGLSYLGLAGAGLASAIVTLIMALRYPVKYRLMARRFTDWRPIWYFSTRATSTSLISNFGVMSPDLIIGKLLGFEAVGLFSRAVGLVQLVERGIMDGVRGVALPYFSACHRRGEPLAAVYARSLGLVLAVSWPALALLAIAATPTIAVLYGERWLAAAPLAAILASGAAARNIASLLSSVIVAGGHVGVLPPITLTWELVKLVLILIGVLWGLPGVAWGYVTAEIVGVALFIRAGRQCLGIGWEVQRPVLRQSLILVLITAGAGAMAGVAARPYGSPALEVLAIAGASVLAWVIYVYTVRHPIWLEVRYLALSCTLHRSSVRRPPR